MDLVIKIYTAVFNISFLTVFALSYLTVITLTL